MHITCTRNESNSDHAVKVRMIWADSSLKSLVSIECDCMFLHRMKLLCKHMMVAHLQQDRERCIDKTYQLGRIRRRNALEILFQEYIYPRRRNSYSFNNELITNDLDPNLNDKSGLRKLVRSITKAPEKPVDIIASTFLDSNSERG